MGNCRTWETVKLQLTFAALCWSNNTVAQWFPTVMLQKLLYVPQHVIANWLWQLLCDV